ncbi:saccharopine dehydrogenase family protein [Tahibacter amnicola]|uniref:Saccharopine dehydrogenase NADP-binding domain-containing protein n=1 Tax=Tahibacter amnicola TaxID=2976241 RepID=A0ABY6BHY1_9GAMM|nr:saccharopine dehydrogenase NADP-binding domain-containing protein [Tahibacter amnicola]UXI68690.1 saccharopine dehydrogenase NADP-binding domain-containing protein [Tahibacter amnicola]
MRNFLIYGANGYTGRLIVNEAVRHGLKPILAGRNREALDAIAAEFGLTRRVFDLRKVTDIVRALDDVPLVLHCAGPFSQTAQPMLEACLAMNAHYLDITGEIDVFAMCHQAHSRARHQNLIVMPGTGFDVVPTDCVAALLKSRLPGATHLVLGFEAGGGPSPGTAKTSVEGLARGGRARVNGQLVDVPLGWKTREFAHDGQVRTAVTIPWGDLYTAHVSTGIPNIETYMVVPPAAVARLRSMQRLRPLLALRPVQALMKRRIDKKTPGPDADKRRSTHCYVWGEVHDDKGHDAKFAIVTPNGYDLTASAAIGIVREVLANKHPGGYYTPSQLMGHDYILKLPGVRRML